MGDMLSFQIINVLNPPCNKNLLNLVNILAQNYNNKKKKTVYIVHKKTLLFSILLLKTYRHKNKFSSIIRW